jgi:RNA polymerase sigma-70 factor (ECF subfamily)
MAPVRARLEQPSVALHDSVSRVRRSAAPNANARDLFHHARGGSALDDVVGEADPEGRFYDSFVDEEIMRAIDDLPHDYRVVVTLSDLEELRYAEIADVLSIPQGTVKSRLFRGRRLLQRRLAGYALEAAYIRLRSVSSSVAPCV